VEHYKCFVEHKKKNLNTNVLTEILNTNVLWNISRQDKTFVFHKTFVFRQSCLKCP
jgi:hypothetical protein